MTAQPISFKPPSPAAYTWRQLIGWRAKLDYVDGMAMQFVPTAQVACLAMRLSQRRDGDPLKMLAAFLFILGDEGGLQFSANVNSGIRADQVFLDNLRRPDNWLPGINDAMATLDRDLSGADGHPLKLRFTRDAVPAPQPFKPVSWDRAEDMAWAAAHELCLMNALPTPH